MNSFQAKIGWKQMRTREIKIIVPFRSYPTCNRKFQKNNKKIKKYHYEFISSQNRLEIDEKEGNKNYRSVPFLPDVQQKIPKKKNSKTIQKIKTIPLLPHFKPKQVGRG